MTSNSFFSRDVTTICVSGRVMVLDGIKKTAEKKAKSTNRTFLKVNKFKAASKNIEKEVIPNPNPALNKILSNTGAFTHFFTMINPLKKRSPSASTPRTDERPTSADSKTKGTTGECSKTVINPVNTSWLIPNLVTSS